MNTMSDMLIYVTNNGATLTIGDGAAAKTIALSMPTDVLEIPDCSIMSHVNTLTIKYGAVWDSKRVTLYTSQLKSFTNVQSLHIERIHLIVDDAKAIAQSSLHHVKIVKCTFEILDPDYTSILQVFSDNCMNIWTLTITDSYVGDEYDDEEVINSLDWTNEPISVHVSPV